MADEAESEEPPESGDGEDPPTDSSGESDAADRGRDPDRDGSRPDESEGEGRTDSTGGGADAAESSGETDAAESDEGGGDSGSEAQVDGVEVDDEAEVDGVESDGDGAETDGDETGPSFTADDLVAGGEYVGNADAETDGDESEGTDADETDEADADSADTTAETDADDETDAPDDLGDEALVDRPRPVPPADAGDDASGGLEPADRAYTPESEAGGFTEGPGKPDPEMYDRPDNMAEATPIERKTGPAEDQEMPLADHVEEMIARLFVIIAIAGVVSVAVFPFGEELIDFMWYQVLPGGDVARPRVYHPLALVITQLKVASLGGLVVALPVFVYQTYAFMRPGLYPHERRYYLAAVPTSLVLAFVGITFAFYVVLPVIFTYFLYYTDEVASIAFALSETFNLILLLMGYLAVVFQIPLFIMLAIMMGLVTRRWLENRRLYFWAGFAGLAFLFSPDPTGMAPFIVAVTMIVLFEGTLLLLRWTNR